MYKKKEKKKDYVPVYAYQHEWRQKLELEKCSMSTAEIIAPIQLKSNQ